MNSTGHHVPNGWGHDAQGLGTLCPRLGQPMPKGWAYDAQGLGNQCPKGGHTMPKAWATFIPWFVRDIR